MSDREKLEALLDRNFEGSCASLIGNNLHADGLVAEESFELYLPRTVREQHLLTVTNNQKALCNFVQSPLLLRDLLHPAKSVVIFSGSGGRELVDSLVNLTKCDKFVYRYSPFFSGSDVWNFLRGRENSPAEAKVLAYSLVEGADPVANNTPRFFRQMVTDLIASIISTLPEDPHRSVKLNSLIELLNLPTEKLIIWLKRYCPSRPGVKNFTALVDAGSSNGHLIHSLAKQWMSPWTIDPVLNPRSAHHFSPSNLLESPSILVVEFPVREALYRPISHFLVREITRLVYLPPHQREENTLPRPVSIYIDDITTWLQPIHDPGFYFREATRKHLQFSIGVPSLSSLQKWTDGHLQDFWKNFGTKFLLGQLTQDDTELLGKLQPETENLAELPIWSGPENIPLSMFLPDIEAKLTGELLSIENYPGSALRKPPVH